MQHLSNSILIYGKLKYSWYDGPIMEHKFSTASEMKYVRQTVHNKLSSREFWALHDKPLTACGTVCMCLDTTVLLHNTPALNLHFTLKTLPWFLKPYGFLGRFQWPRGQRPGSVAVCSLELRVWIPQGAWMSVSCECCVLPGRGLCVGLITRPEESYRVWCVWIWFWRLDNEKALDH